MATMHHRLEVTASLAVHRVGPARIPHRHANHAIQVTILSTVPATLVPIFRDAFPATAKEIAFNVRPANICPTGRVIPVDQIA